MQIKRIVRKRPPAFIASDEELALVTTPSFEEEDGWASATVSAPWNATTFPDDETLGSAEFALEQEEPWTTSTVAVPWNATTVSDDETSAFLHCDDELPWAALTISVPWNVVVIGDDEVQAVTISPVDDVWPWTAVTVAALWTAAPSLDDEASVSLANFSLDEDTPPAFGTIGSAFVRAFTADEDVPGIAPSGALFGRWFKRPRKVKRDCNREDDIALVIAYLETDEGS